MTNLTDITWTTRGAFVVGDYEGQPDYDEAHHIVLFTKTGTFGDDRFTVRVSDQNSVFSLIQQINDEWSIPASKIRAWPVEASRHSESWFV